MLSRVALVRTDVSEELSASLIRVTIGELGTTPAVTHAAKKNTVHFVFLRIVRRLLVTASFVPSSPILVTLVMEALSSSETSVLTRATQRNIQEDAILHSDRRANLESYMPRAIWTPAYADVFHFDPEDGSDILHGTACRYIPQTVILIQNRFYGVRVGE
jgi:hypothetical protein